MRALGLMPLMIQVLGHFTSGPVSDADRESVVAALHSFDWYAD